MKVYVGIDMAAGTFQVELVYGASRKRRNFDNNVNGFEKLVVWLKSFNAEPVLCMEATGRYGEGLAKYLYTMGHDVRVANPKRVRRFAEGLGLLGKSDKADAHAIAEYILHHPDKVREWKPMSDSRETLRDLRCHIGGLEKAKRAMENRALSGISDQSVLQSLQRVIEHLDEELKIAKQNADRVINEDPQLKQDKKALVGQIGVADVNARVMLTRIDFRSFKQGRQVARYAGLTPKREQSGTSINRNGKISKEGPSDLRKALYMAALSAMTHDPSIRQFAERLIARGKNIELVRIAVMRKILIRSWAIIVHGKPFDVNYALTS